MKKRFLIITIALILLCSLFTGCIVLDFFTTNKTTDSENSLGNVVTFEYGDNFTEYDIEFIKTLHGQKTGGPSSEVLLYDTLYDVIKYAQDGHPLFMMHLDNPYIICAYLKPNQNKYELDDEGHYVFDATKYVWYKFNTESEIPESIENNTKTDYAYLLYNCIIRKDIVNKIEYNQELKYYLNYNGDSSLNMIAEDMIVYYHTNGDLPINESYFFIEHENSTSKFQIYTDEKDCEYLILLGERYSENESGMVIMENNFAQETLGEYYSVLSPHFSYFEQFDNEYILDGKRYIDRSIFISLEELIDILFNK